MKKLRAFLFYKKTIDKNLKFLKSEHNLNVDWVYRLHKVYTFTKEDNDNVKIYGEKYVETILKAEMKKIDQTILNLKLYELIGIYEIKPFPEIRSIGLLFGFKLFNTAKVASRLLWSTILLLFLSSGFLLFAIKGLILGGIAWILLFLITRIFLVFRD